MLKWFAELTEFVFSLGYPGVLIALIIEGLGLPFPGDIVMAFYGFAAANGQFHVLGILVVSVIGYTIGALMGYLVSKRFGATWFLQRSSLPFFSNVQVERTLQRIERHGPWMLVVGRFLPGFRAVSSYVAGFSKMDFQPFVIYTGIGAAIWCALWVFVGFWFGEDLMSIAGHVQRSAMFAAAGVILIAAIIWFARRKFSRTSRF